MTRTYRIWTASLLCALLVICRCIPVMAGGELPKRQPPRAAADVSPVVDALYVSQSLMLEMLVNEDCVLEEEDSMLTIGSAPQGREGSMALSITVIPGIQNLAAAAGMIRGELLPQEFPGVQLYDTLEGSLLGSQARFFGFMLPDQTRGVTAVVIANQSLYLLMGLCEARATTNEVLLMDNLIAGMRAITPEKVDPQTRSAVYASNYTGYRLMPGYAGEDLDISSWSALPYGYYTSGTETAAQLPGSSALYTPDQAYYEDESCYWSWGWDQDNEWAFYDTYGDACYSYEAYLGCEGYDYGYDACSSDIYLANSNWQAAAFRGEPDFYEYEDGIWYFYDESIDFLYCYDEYDDAWYYYDEDDDEWYYVDIDE